MRQYRLPKLKKELEFTRDSYGPGQTVAADFKAQRAEAGAAGGAKLRVLATVDGQTVFDKNTQATDAGTLHIEFPLPKNIERGDGQLAVIIDDGGAKETQAKTIPINLGKIDVTFYPEGGELAAGLENRVYFVARNPQGKPVDLSGTLVAERTGDRGPVDQSVPVQTAYEGMGAFSFTPTAGITYRLKITEPAGVNNEPKLPAVSTESEVVLSTGAGVFPAEKPLEFNIRSAKAGLPLVVAAYCRGVQVGEQPMVTKGVGREANPVSIALDDAVGGVIRLTVYNYGVTPPKPVAERLVYRRPAGKLNVRARPGHGRAAYCARASKVDMSLLVTDENGKPVPAVLGVAVADDALLNLADDRTPSMPTHFLLTSEIEKPEDLEHADFYLSDGSKGKTTAAEALDLLLGTQGWRRFVEKSLVAANGRNRDPDKTRQVGRRRRRPAAADVRQHRPDSRQLQEMPGRLPGRSHPGAQHAHRRQLLRRTGARAAGGDVGSDADRLGHAPLGFGHRSDHLLPDHRRDPDGPRPPDARPKCVGGVCLLSRTDAGESRRCRSQA